jgi:NAD-specific glutamate dehydrogenase
MAKMTDEEFNKALDTIIDSVTEAMLENVMKANEQMGKILLKNYEQVKKLIRHIEK